MVHRLVLVTLALLFIAPVAWGADNRPPLTLTVRCLEYGSFSVGGKSFAQLIESYTDVHEVIIPQSFSLAGRGVHEVKGSLCRFNRPVTSGKVLEALGKRRLRAARADECLAFGATFKSPDLFFSPVVCLGALLPSDAGQLALLIASLPDSPFRILWLSGWGGDWNPGYQFLAVRK